MDEAVERIGEMISAEGLAEEQKRSALVAELVQLPDDHARAVLRRVVGERGAAAVPLLEELATEAEGPLALAAVQLLAEIKDAAAAAALRGLAESLVSGEVRKAARRGLHRLSTAGISPAAVEAAPKEGGAAWPVYKAVASVIDGAGNRAIWFGFKAAGEIQVVALLVNEETGIQDVFARAVARPRFERYLRTYRESEEQPWVEMPVDYCRHLVEEAHALNAVTATPLPVEYLAWRDRIGRPEQRYDQPLVYSVINVAEVRWDPRYLDHSDQLLELDMFRAWALDRSELEQFVQEMETARRSHLLLAGVSSEARLRMVVDRAIQRLFDVKRRALLKRRLEEMAYVLWKMEREYNARLTLAAAVALEPPTRSLFDHVFVRALVEWSLELAESEETTEKTRFIGRGVALHLP